MSAWLLAFAGGAALPSALEALRQPVAKRASDPDRGQFVELPNGRIHYWWRGPETGPVAVCIHGLTTPGYVWDGFVPHLAAKGYRVLCLDLFGRGLSARPRGPQSLAFFNTLLSDLLSALEVKDPVTLIGNSMGSAIATGFAARYPERVRQVVLFVPAGLGHDLGVGARVVQKVPVLGDWVFHLAYPRSLRRSIEPERKLPSSVENITDRQLDELRYRGFLRSVLSSIRGVLSEPMDDAHRALQSAGVPVLAIWGAQDEVIPIDRKEVLSTVNPDARHIVLPTAGHGLVYTHTDEMWALLRDALIL